MRKKNRIIGIVASSVAALGLAALAVGSAGAATSGTDSKFAETAKTAKPGKDGHATMPKGVAVERTKDGGMKVHKLTDEELENFHGKPTKPQDSATSTKGGAADESAKGGKTIKGEKPGKGDKHGGIAVSKTKDGFEVRKLTKDELEDHDGWNKVTPPKSPKSDK